MNRYLTEAMKREISDIWGFNSPGVLVPFTPGPNLAWRELPCGNS
jgi:hypothetical protein